MEYSINEQGKKEIREFLAENHKLGGDYFSDQMIDAWAKDAEFQLSEGNSATIEICASDSIYGRTQEFRISDAGINKEQIDMELEDQ